MGIDRNNAYILWLREASIVQPFQSSWSWKQYGIGQYLVLSVLHAIGSRPAIQRAKSTENLNLPNVFYTRR